VEREEIESDKSRQRKNQFRDSEQKGLLSGGEKAKRLYRKLRAERRVEKGKGKGKSDIHPIDNRRNEKILIQEREERDVRPAHGKVLARSG